MRPIPLPPNTVASFYPGAGRIGAFRRHPSLTRTDPEDWIASTTARTGLAPLGLTTLADGTLLRDRFSEDPQAWFGPEHTARYGACGALLVKLLDAGHRLPLHVHPDRAFARQHLDSDYGKTEAWLVLHAELDACVHLGFSRDIRASELHDWVENQNTGALLTNTNTIPVNAGDVLLCPAGVPHAIGEGILVIELQEMTDFSIMLEWADYPLDPDVAFLGLGAHVALTAVHRAAILGDDLQELRGQCIRSLATGQTGSASLLPAAADEFFVAEQVIPVAGGEQCDQRFAILIVNDGAGTLHSEAAEDIALTTGQSYLIPHAAGTTRLTGELSAIRCYPA